MKVGDSNLDYTQHAITNSESSTTNSVDSINMVKYINLLQDCAADTNIYTEADGSHWLRVVHHNNPGTNLFNSTGNFANGEYIDSNRWYFLNKVAARISGTWEFIIVEKLTSNQENPYVYRFSQTKNPESAVYEDVDAADITKKTGATSLVSGTTTYTTSGDNWGGLYKRATNRSYLVANNGTSGNWFGALGCWSNWPKNDFNGIPGYDTTTYNISSGYVDLYIRIDSILSTYM